MLSEAQVRTMLKAMGAKARARGSYLRPNVFQIICHKYSTLARYLNLIEN